MTRPVRCKCNCAVSETGVDGEIFLVELETEEVFYLDAMNAGRPLDWYCISGPARDGGFRLPLKVFFALLAGLGVAMGDASRHPYEPLGGLRGMVLRKVIANFRTYFPQELPMTILLWREMTICAEPLVAVLNIGLRLKGLIWAMDGNSGICSFDDKSSAD